MLTAVAQSADEPLPAEDLEKGDGPFACPACARTVLLKKGRIRVPHFAHEVLASDCPLAGKKERDTRRHMEIQRAIFRAFKNEPERFQASMEARIGHHWTDIAVEDLALGRKFAIEVQRSAIDPRDIEDRTDCYGKHGYATLWVVALPMGCGATRPSEAVDNIQRVPHWVKALHKLHMGAVFYHADGKELEPAHFEDATSWVEATDWGGGYDRVLKASKTVLAGPATISIDRLESCRNKHADNALVLCLPYNLRWWERRETRGSRTLASYWKTETRAVPPAKEDDGLANVAKRLARPGFDPLEVAYKFKARGDYDREGELLDLDLIPDDFWVQAGLPIKAFLKHHPERRGEVQSALVAAQQVLKSDPYMTGNRYLRHEPYLAPAVSRHGLFSFALVLKFDNNGNTLVILPEGYELLDEDAAEVRALGLALEVAL